MANKKSNQTETEVKQEVKTEQVVSKKVKATKPKVVKSADVAAPVVPVTAESPSKSKVKVVKDSSKSASKSASKAASKKEVASVATEASEKPADGKKSPRFFKCLFGEDTIGRYKGQKPKQAANKAFTNIIRTLIKEKKENPIGKELKFDMVECTRGSQRKCCSYTGVREALDKPLVVTIKKTDGPEKTIEYKYVNKISKVKEVTESGVTASSSDSPARSTAQPTAEPTASSKKSAKKVKSEAVSEVVAPVKEAAPAKSEEKKSAKKAPVKKAAAAKATN